MSEPRTSDPGSTRPPPSRVSRVHPSIVETRLVDVRAGFMTLEVDEGKVLSFPFEDAGTERACRSGLESGEVVVVLEMRDDVPLKVVEIRRGRRGAPAA